MSFNATRRVNIPPVTLNLIIINVLVWVVEMIVPDFADNAIYRHCGLHYFGANDFNPAQIITYMFVHDAHNIMHIFFNMFTLFMFGPILERTWGAKRFLLFYMVCGVGAAVVQEAVWAFSWDHDFIAALAQSNHVSFSEMEQYILSLRANHDAELAANEQFYLSSMVTVGASGAIFGLLLGFAFVFPNMPLYLFFIPIPIKAKWMVLGYGILEFFLGVSGGGTIAHFAHLGGMLFGLVMLLIWKKKGTLHGNSFY